MKNCLFGVEIKSIELFYTKILLVLLRQFMQLLRVHDWCGSCSTWAKSLAKLNERDNFAHQIEKMDMPHTHTRTKDGERFFNLNIIYNFRFGQPKHFSVNWLWSRYASENILIEKISSLWLWIFEKWWRE